MRALVVGCNGFLGATFGDVAHRRGYTVLGVGRRAQASLDWPGSYQQADVAAEGLDELIRATQPDLLFHGAGGASVGSSFERPVDDQRAATGTLMRVLDGVRRSGVKPTVLFPSSASVYGSPERIPIDETTEPRPISPYGFHKLQCELIVREFRECFGLDVVIGRVFSTFGRRQRRLLVWELAKQALGADPEIVIQGTGKESRDYLEAEELCERFLDLALLRERPAVVNLASGSETTTEELAHVISRLAGNQKPVRCLGLPRPGDPPRWVADVSRLNGCVPRARPGLEAGLKKTVAAWTG